jgi:acyl-coenzyme A synthetase/AMP-(fatty) acid ligase
MCTGAERLERPGTVGRCLIGEIAVLDDDGSPVEAGKIGTIWMRRPTGADK